MTQCDRYQPFTIKVRRKRAGSNPVIGYRDAGFSSLSPHLRRMVGWWDKPEPQATIASSGQCPKRLEAHRSRGRSLTIQQDCNKKTSTLWSRVASTSGIYRPNRASQGLLLFVGRKTVRSQEIHCSPEVIRWLPNLAWPRQHSSIEKAIN